MRLMCLVNNRASATPGAGNGSEQPEDQVKQEEPDVSDPRLSPSDADLPGPLRHGQPEYGQPG